MPPPANLRAPGQCPRILDRSQDAQTEFIGKHSEGIPFQSRPDDDRDEAEQFPITHIQKLCEHTFSLVIVHVGKHGAHVSKPKAPRSASCRARCRCTIRQRLVQVDIAEIFIRVRSTPIRTSLHRRRARGRSRWARWGGGESITRDDIGIRRDRHRHGGYTGY